MPTFDSPKQAIHQGQVFIRNAEDALKLDIDDEEQLYKWENQLAALDEFLADTEDMVESEEELAEIRAEAREKKGQLEANLADFFDQPVEADEDEANIEALLGVGVEIIEEAEAALEAEVEDMEEVRQLEHPLLAVKQWLADTEPYDDHKVMAQARKDMKAVKFALSEKLEELTKAYAEAED